MAATEHTIHYPSEAGQCFHVGVIRLQDYRGGEEKEDYNWEKHFFPFM